MPSHDSNVTSTMKAIALITALLLLFACSSERKAQYHYKKALKHGLKVVQDSDTIRINTIDSIPVIVNDTIVWQKYITTKDTIIQYRTVEIPKTRWQTRIEYKYKTKIEKIKGNTIYKTAKAQVKYRTRWWPFWIGLAIPLLLRLAYNALLSKLNR